MDLTDCKTSAPLPKTRSGRKHSGPIRAAFLRFAMLCMSNKCNIAMRAKCGAALRPLERLCAVVSLCVCEPFMATVIPYYIANVDHGLARVLILAFTVNLYTCNFVKNLLRVPRPSMARHGRPLIQEHGFGFPSSHSAIAVAAPLAAACFLADGSPAGPAVGLALLFGFAVGIARLLLGVHSVADVLGGWALGAATGGLMMGLISSGTYAWALATPLLGVVLIPATIGMCLLHHPSRDMSAIKLDGGNKRDTTVEESVIAMGTWSGVFLASWRAVLLPSMQAPAIEAVVAMGSSPVALAIRYGVAIGCMVTAKTAAKAVASAALPASLFPSEARRAIIVRWVTYVTLIFVCFDVTAALVGML
jgi:hypothetical protein